MSRDQAKGSTREANGRKQNTTTIAMPRFICGVLIALLLAPAAARAQNEEVVYYHTDAIGSVRMITDSTGAVLARYDYTPFGQPWNPPGTVEVMQFTGKELELQSELDYFNARDFMSLTGRFTTVDPGHGNGDVFDPQSWNGYAYARNNPLVFTDPSGTEYQICAFGGGDFPGSCGWISNPDFFSLLRDPGVGFRLSGGWIYSGNVRVGSYRSAGFDDWAQLTGALSSAWLREQGVAMAQSAAISATGGLATGILSGGLAAEVGEATYIASVTAKGSRYANTVAGLGARQFERNLLANGFRVAQRTIGKNGPVTILKNAQRTYVIYKATSTGEASAQVFTAAGQSLGKIRLIGF